MDRNKLAWKGTPGPWKVTRHIGGRNSGWGIYDKGGDYLIGNIDSNIMSPERIEFNAHMASAAPEMAEFIADLLEAEQKGHVDLPVGFTERAETLLKKAYNF